MAGRAGPVAVGAASDAVDVRAAVPCRLVKRCQKPDRVSAARRSVGAAGLHPGGPAVSTACLDQPCSALGCHQGGR